MRFMALDPVATHVNNPNCPMRLVRKPNGSWMCADCGFDILQKMIDTDHLRKLCAELDAKFLGSRDGHG